ARLDSELEMYKRLQRFSSQALKLYSKRSFVDTLAEAVVDIFETEGSLVLLEQHGENNFTILKHEGLGFDDVPEEHLQQCIRNVSSALNEGGSPILSAETLNEHPSFAKMHEALWYSFQDDALSINLHVAGLISKERSALYNPLLERHATIFSVFAQTAFSLLANLHRALMIRRQLESEQAAMDEMKKLNNQLVDYNQELEKLNRDLDQFVYSASHDLRAPVLAISGIVDEILDPLTEEETKKQDLNRIQKVVGRLDDTISDIVSYSKNARLPIVPEKIDLESMILELFDSLRYLKHFDISIVVDLKNSCDLWNDRSRIQSLLKNLLSNAIKFSVERPEGSRIRVSGEVNADSCFMEIADNGEGIAEEYQTRVFDMFYRAASGSNGTGLGLYICNEIMKKLGGVITLKSEVGKGTIIGLTLPNQISNG
ncbi:MAG: sensor histidine kinase, partial [Bacteroidota bacterium]